MASIETYSLYCLIYLIPELKSPFFGVLKILAFVDLASILFSCICMRMGYLLSQISILQPPKQYNVISTFLQFGMVVLGGVQGCLHVILAFNRLTAILFPHRYSTLWEGKSFYGIISIGFVFPSLMYSWILYFGGSVLLSPVFTVYVIDAMKTGIPGLHKATINTVIVVLTCVLSFIFDLITFILLKKGNLLKSNESKYKKEFRLLTVSVAFLIVHTLFLATAIYTLVFPFQDGIRLLIFLQCTVELQSLISPFCVLLLNQNLRKDFFYKGSKTAVVSIAPGSHRTI